MPSKADFKKLSADDKMDEVFGLIAHLVPLSTQLSDVVNALSARFHGMEDRDDIDSAQVYHCFVVPFLCQTPVSEIPSGRVGENDLDWI